jgi:MGT family glycosyltransferase
MTLLVISPDYASHLLPLATLATAWRDAGEEVVVATGPACDAIVSSFGFLRCDLRLGRGSNPGVIRPQDQVREEDAALRGFFAATAAGMVPALAYQARERRTDLLWEPVRTGRAVLDVVEAVAPDAVVVDHLAFSARLALRAGGVPHADVVLGHPSALPVAGEVYGLPPAWPTAFTPDPAAVAGLEVLCRTVSAEFTDAWNAASLALDRTAAPVEDAFATTGDLLLLNYPQALHPPARTAALPPHAFLGSAVREDVAPPAVAAWLDAHAGEPIAYVSFGSFLSARSDALATVVAALRDLALPVALAIGSADRDVLGPLPPQWLVAEHLPQVAVLRRAAVAVSHGGNNSVTEALTCGVPLVVLPFSTDQFAGAAAVEDAGVGLALDPQAASPAEVAAAVRQALDGPAAGRARDLAAELTRRPGRDVARDAVTGRSAAQAAHS